MDWNLEVFKQMVLEDKQRKIDRFNIYASTVNSRKSVYLKYNFAGMYNVTMDGKTEYEGTDLHEAVSVYDRLS